MERKLTKVVDGTEITLSGKMCSCGTDVANDLCSWENDHSCGDGGITDTKKSSMTKKKIMLFSIIPQNSNIFKKRYLQCGKSVLSLWQM